MFRGRVFIDVVELYSSFISMMQDLGSLYVSRGEWDFIYTRSNIGQ